MSDHEDEDKNEFPVVTSQWNGNIENNIKEIGEACKGYKWMNIQSAKVTGRKYDYLMYATILIGPLAGVFAAVSGPDEDEEDCENTSASVLRILVILCGFLSGVLASIIKFSKFEQKSIDHKTAAAKYASLEGNIRRQLSLFREDRVNAGKYLEWISTSFDDLFSGSPLISTYIYNQWVTFAKKQNIHIPKEYGLLIDIDASDQINDLCNIGEIKVNKHDSSHRNITENPVEKTKEHRRKSTDPFKVVMTGKDGKGSLQRTKQYTAFPELNRYGDGKMTYEMSRMFGIKKIDTTIK